MSRESQSVRFAPGIGAVGDDAEVLYFAAVVEQRHVRLGDPDDQMEQPSSS